MLSASANKLSRLKEQAEEYAALIMEELDPERFGYIEVGTFFYLIIEEPLLIFFFPNKNINKYVKHSQLVLPMTFFNKKFVLPIYIYIWLIINEQTL
jgi:hypothetical protein